MLQHETRQQQSPGIAFRNAEACSLCSHKDHCRGVIEHASSDAAEALVLRFGRDLLGKAECLGHAVFEPVAELSRNTFSRSETFVQILLQTHMGLLFSYR